MLYHYHEWVPHVEDMPDHVPHHVRHRYRAERCVRCDEVRWVRDDTDTEERMKLTILTDTQLMQHWNVAAQICDATSDDQVLHHYSRQLKYLNHEMDRRDTERRPIVDKRAKFPHFGENATVQEPF